MNSYDGFGIVVVFFCFFFFRASFTTVFIDTRLWKTKHPQKRFQNFRHRDYWMCMYVLEKNLRLEFTLVESLDNDSAIRMNKHEPF